MSKLRRRTNIDGDKDDRGDRNAEAPVGLLLVQEREEVRVDRDHAGRGVLLPDPDLQGRGNLSRDAGNFTGLVLGCIEAKIFK